MKLLNAISFLAAAIVAGPGAWAEIDAGAKSIGAANDSERVSVEGEVDPNVASPHRLPSRLVMKALRARREHAASSNGGTFDIDPIDYAETDGAAAKQERDKILARDPHSRGDAPRVPRDLPDADIFRALQEGAQANGGYDLSYSSSLSLGIGEKLLKKEWAAKAAKASEGTSKSEPSTSLAPSAPPSCTTTTPDNPETLSFPTVIVRNTTGAPFQCRPTCAGVPIAGVGVWFEFTAPTTAKYE